MTGARQRAALALGLALAGCTVDDTTSRRVLEANAFSSPVLTDTPFTGCGDSDWFSRSFTATNARGERVRGVICCGILKNCTLRF